MHGDLCCADAAAARCNRLDAAGVLFHWHCGGRRSRGACFCMCLFQQSVRGAPLCMCCGLGCCWLTISALPLAVDFCSNWTMFDAIAAYTTWLCAGTPDEGDYRV